MSSTKTFKKGFLKLQVTKFSRDFKEATTLVEVPLEPPGPGQVLVKSLYLGVNATDINATVGAYNPGEEPPFDTGFEVLGVVEAVGDKVDSIIVGQHVIVLQIGGYAEYLYVDAKNAVPVPEARPEYVACLIVGLTATIGLDVAGRIKAGDKVLVTAAAGGTGHICVQWAKSKGCHVVGLTSSEEKAKFLLGLGCDRVINYRTEDLDSVLTKEYPDGLDAVWETIGGETYKTLFEHLAVKGRLVVIGTITGYKTVGLVESNIPNLSEKLLLGAKSLTGFIIFSYGEYYKEYFGHLIGGIASNKLKISVDTGSGSPGGPFKGIGDVARAVEYLHTGKSSGKVVVPL